MDGERGDVGRLDHAPDRQGLAELLAAPLQLIAEDRRRQRRVDESRRDEIHADRRELEREVLRQGGTGGREGRDQREPRRGAAATGAAHEKQGASRPNLAYGAAGNLRSEEHTSELQSLRHLVCRLLLEKKKQYKLRQHTT